MIHRAFRYRISPTDEQEETLRQFAGVTRFVYNLALEQRNTFWRQYLAQTGGRLNFASQGRQLTALRCEVDWIGAAPSSALTQALRDLDRAFAAFFAGRASYPTPRRKGINDSFRWQAKPDCLRPLNDRWTSLRIPNLGWVKFRQTRPVIGRVLCITVSQQGGAWFATFACEIEHKAMPSALPSVGIDRGIANTIALSTGELLSTPATDALLRRKKRAQRILARRVRGSNRYRKQRRRLSRIAAKIARVRDDWRHRVTTDIARRFGTAILEDLKVQNMTARGRGKHGLNRSIMEQGWGGFERTLAYKLEERGGTLEKINPAYTSQTCSACGVVDSKARESQARFVCRSCDFEGHADHNAAIVILRRSTPVMPVEVADCGTVEAGTINLAA